MKLIIYLIFLMAGLLTTVGYAAPLNTAVAVPPNHYFIWLRGSVPSDQGVKSATFLPYIYFRNESALQSAFVSFDLTSFEKDMPMEVAYSLGDVRGDLRTVKRDMGYKGGSLKLSDGIPQNSAFNPDAADRLQLLNATVVAETQLTVHLLIVAEKIDDLKNFYSIPDGSIFRWEPIIVLK